MEKRIEVCLIAWRSHIFIKLIYIYFLSYVSSILLLSSQLQFGLLDDLLISDFLANTIHRTAERRTVGLIMNLEQPVETVREAEVPRDNLPHCHLSTTYSPSPRLALKSRHGDRRWRITI
jgi:hypothetical protein